MEAATNTLRSMFPNSSAEQCVSALKANNWDLSATIDYMLAKTASEEQAQQVQQVQQQVIHSNPPPQPQQETEEDKILKEFLFLEQHQQQRQQQALRVPTPPPFNPTVVQPPPPQHSIEVVEEVESIITNIPPPPPPHIIQPQQPPQVQQAIEGAEEKKVQQEKSRDLSLLKSISSTLRELEKEVKNLVMEPKRSTSPPQQPDIIKTEQVEEAVENEIININNNNNAAENNVEIKEYISHQQSNNGIPNEVKNAIDQLELLFSSSLEKTEKILNELKEEISGWKIKDNVKTFTVTVRNELSDILSSLANYISPEQTEQQISKREEKRDELENKLKELKEHNHRLEEERRVAIEKIENKDKTSATSTSSND